MEIIVEKYKFALEQQGLETIRHSPKVRHFQAHHVQVFFKAKGNGSQSPNFKIKTYFRYGKAQSLIHLSFVKI